MDLNNFDKTTFPAIFGLIIKTGKAQGRNFSQEEIEGIAVDAIQRGYIKKEWYTTRGGKFSLTETPEKVMEEVSDKELYGKDSAGYRGAHNDDAALARLYLYKLNSCLERRIPWELSLAELRQIAKRKTCYYSGEKFVHQELHRNRITLDRIDSSIGYTKENTVACCHWVNQLKSELFENSASKFSTNKKTLLKILSKID